MKIKTIDLDVKEWNDKSNGNTYFSAKVTLNKGKNQKIIEIPFQYGYDGHYREVTRMKLVKDGYIPDQDRTPLYRYCDDNNIILRESKVKEKNVRDI